MKSQFSNVFFVCCASWFLKKSLNVAKLRILAENTAAQICCVSGCFKNLWRTIRGSEIVTRSKQCNVWCRTIPVRTDLSTRRRTSITWRPRRRKKRFTRNHTCREYRLVRLREMHFYERRRVLLLPGARRSEWEVRYFRFVFKLLFAQKLNYLES